MEGVFSCSYILLEETHKSGCLNSILHRKHTCSLLSLRPDDLLQCRKIKGTELVDGLPITS